MTPPDPAPRPAARPAWQRHLWLGAGFGALLLGIVGLILPLLPTTPFVILAAFCFSNGSPRWERWLLTHPRFGPVTLAWRQHRAVPLRAKQLAIGMMAVSATGAWFALPPPWRWVPGTVCLAVAVWLWRLPTAGAPGPRPDPAP